MLDVVSLIMGSGRGKIPAAAVKEAVAEWLDENVDPETGYVLDKTLSIEGAAADAAAVGELKSAFEVMAYA